MGGTSSKNSGVIGHLMPLYYIKDAVVSPQEAQQARKSWEMITNDTSPAFIEGKAADPPLPSISCLAWTYETFYDRLFDVHPSAKPLFKNNMVVQGKAFCSIINIALGSLEDLEGLSKILSGMAKVHTRKGVLTYQYGIMGECLIWTLTKVLGSAFTDEVKIVWVKIYSIMLSVIIPVAAKEEKIYHGY